VTIGQLPSDPVATALTVFVYVCGLVIVWSLLHLSGVPVLHESGVQPDRTAETCLLSPRYFPYAPRSSRATGATECCVLSAGRATVEPDRSAAPGFGSGSGGPTESSSEPPIALSAAGDTAGRQLRSFRCFGRPTEEGMVVGRVCANAGVRHWLGVRDAPEAAWAFQGLSGHIDRRVRELLRRKIRLVT
jgi:hypothetical protein